MEENVEDPKTTITEKESLTLFHYYRWVQGMFSEYLLQPLLPLCETTKQRGKKLNRYHPSPNHNIKLIKKKTRGKEANGNMVI